MFKKILVVFLLSAVGTLLLEAQTPKPTPSTIPRAQPVEKPKKPGFFEKIFPKKPTPEPTLVPPPSPTPKPKKKKPRTAPTPVETMPTPSVAPGIEAASTDSTTLPDSLPPLISEIPEDANAPIATPAPAAALISQEMRENPLNQPIPLVEGTSAPVSIVAAKQEQTPESLAEKAAVQRIQFRKIKAKALEDTKLQELKLKSEQSSTPQERVAALKNYYPKLFASMRKLDETLSMEIDEMEAASRRRIERLESETAPAN